MSAISKLNKIKNNLYVWFATFHSTSMPAIAYNIMPNKALVELNVPLCATFRLPP